MIALAPHLLTLGLALGAPLAPARGQDERVDRRPEIAAQLDRLRAHTWRKGAEDDQAVAVIDELTDAFPTCGPRDRADIVDAFQACFRLKRKELEPGLHDDRLFIAAAISLGEMGPESVKPLLGLLDHKHHKRNLALQIRVTAALGKTRDPRGVRPLLRLLETKDARLLAASATALGEFGGLDEKERKRIFEALLEVMMEQKQALEEDPDDVVVWNRWNTISGPVVASLQRLSGHDERDPAAWRLWWKENARQSWEKEGA